MNSKVNYIYRDFYINYNVLISKGTVSIECRRLDPKRKMVSSSFINSNMFKDDVFYTSIDEVTFDVEKIINKAKEQIDKWYDEKNE